MVPGESFSPKKILSFYELKQASAPFNYFSGSTPVVVVSEWRQCPHLLYFNNDE